ncbi:MAG: beta-glucosidase, partial [Solirubrobacteraceae bacterium]|nr:beta-glucosidase [Solirubrobacteraceae bacterium]
PYACTINEPQILAHNGYLQGEFPPGIRDPTRWRKATRRLIEAHAAALRAIKGGRGAPLAGVCLQMPAFEPARPEDPACVARFQEIRREMIDVYFEDLQGDFVGVQYYTRQRVDPAAASGFAPAPPDAPLTQMGWELYPEGLYEALARAAQGGLPLVITENGIATADDAHRMAHLRDHLAQVKRALDDGIDVRGYLYWSAFDNFEWNHGYEPKFGLIGVDRASGARIVRPSARAFGKLAASGRLADLAAL